MDLQVWDGSQQLTLWVPVLGVSLEGPHFLSTALQGGGVLLSMGCVQLAWDGLLGGMQPVLS